jgi:hypothetical protein
MREEFCEGRWTISRGSKDGTPNKTDSGTGLHGHKRLIAKWTNMDDNDIGTPEFVVWEDGSPATGIDFRKHELDTHFWAVSDQGHLEKHMFPEIVGKVTFDQDAKDWIVRGEGVVTAALDLKDSCVSDGEIIGALYLLPIYFRSKINRQ